MNIKVVDQKGEEVKNEVNISTPPSVVGDESILETQVGGLFDMKPSEVSLNSDRIKTLIEYAKTQTDDHSTPNLLWAIRNLTYKVGTPPLGEKLINYIGKYAYLRLEKAKLDKEVQNYERNGSV